MENKKTLIDVNEFRKIFWLKLQDLRFIGPMDVEHVILNTPTVDAMEVVHGEWIVCGDGEYVPFMCSACGKTTSWYHAQTANYCPNCGAKMDKKDG